MRREEMVEILSVRPIPHGPGLLDWNIEEPIQGAASRSYGINLSGWAVGEQSPVERIEIYYEDRVVGSTSPNVLRPDIAAVFPHTAWSETSGFTTQVSVVALPERFRLGVRVVLQSGEFKDIAEVNARRRFLPSLEPGLIQPLSVTTVGRTGSSWLVWLLSRHPNLIAYKPFAEEARVGAYWASVLMSLSQWKSYLQQFSPADTSQPRWWLGDDARRGSEDPEMVAWLGGSVVEDIARNCAERIQGFYAHIAEQPEAMRYFVEKHDPSQYHVDLLAELYPGFREVILVRDFRDVLASVLSFNARRGYNSFGREFAASDEEYVQSIFRPAAEALMRRADEKGDALVVRYEDLLVDQDRTLQRILDHLGVASDVDTRRAMHECATDDESRNWRSEHRTTADSGQSVGRWRRDLPATLIDTCNEALANQLEFFGYR
jgi:hypothetical protein